MFHLFFGVCCKCVCLDVAYVFEICFISVLSRCCLCFCNGFNCFSCVFASFSDACFKYFIWLQTYVASVACKCFKSRSSVASPSSSSAASPRCLLLRRLLPLLSMLVRFVAARASCGHAKLREKRTASTGVRTSGRYQARI